MPIATPSATPPNSHQNPHELTLVGAGPGALATVLALVNYGNGVIERILDNNGIGVVNNRTQIGSGALRRYANVPLFLSNSPGPDWTNWLPREGVLGDLQAIPEARKVGNNPGVLEFGPIADLLDAVGDRVHALLTSHSKSRHYQETTANSIWYGDDNTLLVNASTASQVVPIGTKDVVLSTGGKRQPIPEELQRYADKIITSDAVHSSLKAIEQIANAAQNPGGVVWVGGSFSIGSGNYALLQHAEKEGIHIADGGSLIVHRNPLREYYTSAQEAIEAGYYEFTDEDIDPDDDSVHRFSGLRNVARDHIRSVKNGSERRIALQPVEQLTDAADVFKRAKHIVVATGYPANAIPIYDASGAQIGPHITEKRQTVGVTENGQVLDTHGNILPHIYANGIAHATERGGAPFVAFNAFGKFTGLKIIRTMLKQSLNRITAVATY